MKAPPNITKDELVTLMHDQAKASSITGVKTLEMLNRAGLKLEKMAGAPTEIAARAGYEYFKIDAGGPQWKRVKDEFTFAISVGKLGPSTADSIPIPLLILGGLAFALMAAAGVSLIARRMQARRAAADRDSSVGRAACRRRRHA